MLFLMRKKDAARDLLFVIVKYLYCACLDLLRWRYFGRKELTRNEKK